MATSDPAPAQTSTAVLSSTPTHDELEAAAALNGETQVVGGALIAGGVQFGIYRDGVLVPDDSLRQKVDFTTGLVIKPVPAVEGASLYETQAHEPVKMAAKKAVRTRVKTQESIDEANALTEEEEAAQVALEEAAAQPPEPPATAP